MIEAKAARDQHENLSISGSEGKTMEICAATIWDVCVQEGPHKQL